MLESFLVEASGHEFKFEKDLMVCLESGLHRGTSKAPGAVAVAGNSRSPLYVSRVAAAFCGLLLCSCAAGLEGRPNRSGPAQPVFLVEAEANADGSVILTLLNPTAVTLILDVGQNKNYRNCVQLQNKRIFAP